ncbi:MAG: hypothetical protein Q4G46_02775 [Propionibacteriaceae bacterium]|nr:hypothetical protein [Propionibacteriaceae bacterium]
MAALTKNMRVGADFGRRASRDLTQRRQQTHSLHSREQHLDSALAWLAKAQDISGDGGVSYGYSLRGGWLPAYRETTGYILETFYDAAAQLDRPELAERAERAARWVLQIQNPDGGIANLKYGPDGIVFDTGQCLFGLVRAFEETGDEAFLVGARKAGQWLVEALGTDPMWVKHEHMGTPHVYNTRTAWALLRLNEIDPNDAWVKAARTNLDWAIASQQVSGFFNNNAFVKGDSPYTHNISYAICGLQESGWLLGDEAYVASARRCSDAALAHMAADGFIPGQISPDGVARARYSCLTGQAQLAIAWGRQVEHGGPAHLADAARRSVGFVMRHHVIESGPEAARGAVAGSFPIWGRYAPASYPNWATKFFADALLQEMSS